MLLSEETLNVLRTVFGATRVTNTRVHRDPKANETEWAVELSFGKYHPVTCTLYSEMTPGEMRRTASEADTQSFNQTVQQVLTDYPIDP